MAKKPRAEGLDPLIDFFFDELEETGDTDFTVAAVAGLAGPSTFRGWKLGHSPILKKFNQALNAIGYQLAIIPKDRGVTIDEVKETN